MTIYLLYYIINIIQDMFVRKANNMITQLFKHLSPQLVITLLLWFIMVTSVNFNYQFAVRA